MRIIDRYVVREVFWPFCIGLAIFTFILIIPVLIQEAEELVAKGTPALVVAHLMWLLVPQALGLTIPMSLLLGLLVAFGRLSSDREFVAMQACGVSLLRLLRPVAVLSVIAWAATSYVLLVAVPSANQSYREILFSVLASRAEGEVKPRVFFEGLPDLVLYVREVPATGGWNDVFMAYNRPGQPQSIYLARHGRVLINREKRTVEVVLQGGTRHTADTAGKYQVFGFDRQLLSVSSESLFPRGGPAKGEREMTIGELRERIAQFEKDGTATHNPRMEIHKKFSIPVACLVFGLIGLALGVSNRRGSKLASFVVGIGVIFIYYVLMWLGLSMAKGAMVPPWLAMWLPNIGLGALGGLLFLWRDRVADRPIRITLPPFMTGTRRGPVRPAVGGRRRTLAARLSRLRLPSPGLLDRYVAGIYAKVFAIAFVGLTGLFYIAQFIDLSDKVFKGTSTWNELLSYFWYATPQYVYYVIPLSVLVAALVTIGVLTKNSELIVMKACGISLYRVAFPVLVAALAAGGALFLLEETILGPSNRRAEAIRHVMRGGSPQTFDVLNRRWVVGSHGEIYHFNYFDPRKRQLLGLSIFRFEGAMRALASRTYAERAMYVGARAGARADAWHVEQGWTRTFDKEGDAREYRPFATAQIAIEPASYFATQQPEPKYMSYTQLRRYIERLRASGLDVVEQQVALERKISFPFVTLIMTLIAVPFAVTTGRHGAMYGIGVGIVLAISYWVAMSVFGAIGSGGLVAPALAAWAPNLLFGAGAAYFLLTVRT
jgi:LPS export ABC transporter permease LptG/LPS export ABC transporter permease LptF